MKYVHAHAYLFCSYANVYSHIYTHTHPLPPTHTSIHTHTHSGIVADGRTLVDHARVEAQNHWFMYDEKRGVRSTVQAVCDKAMKFGEAGQVCSVCGV
jgi:uncharacterized lipoprotein YajG